MNIRQAILKAADHIERNPSAFNFGAVRFPKPNDCGTPGCALGWIGVFAGLPDMYARSLDRSDSWCVLRAAREVLGLPDKCHTDSVFYERMDEVAGTDWRHSAATCARALRLYADRYHPAESRSLIPESVRAIFTATPAELAEALNS